MLPPQAAASREGEPSWALRVGIDRGRIGGVGAVLGAQSGELIKKQMRLPKAQ